MPCQRYRYSYVVTGRGGMVHGGRYATKAEARHALMSDLRLWARTCFEARFAAEAAAWTRLHGILADTVMRPSVMPRAAVAVDGGGTLSFRMTREIDVEGPAR